LLLAETLVLRLQAKERKREVLMMSPYKEQSLLELSELSGLEVEPLEMVVNAPEPEQDWGLDTLTIAPSDIEAVALLMGKGASPVNDVACCCCCCIPCG